MNLLVSVEDVGLQFNPIQTIAQTVVPLWVQQMFPERHNRHQFHNQWTGESKDARCVPKEELREVALLVAG